MQPVELRTERLILRDWTDADREPFAALNADPEVMAHFPAPLVRAESDAMVDRIVTSMRRRGFGLWAVEVIGGPACVGFVGTEPDPVRRGVHARARGRVAPRPERVGSGVRTGGGGGERRLRVRVGAA